MFVLLLVVTFTIATVTSFCLARLFDQPLAGIIQRLIPDELAVAWQRYVLFGLYLVGVNGGVRIWEFEKYVLPIGGARQVLVLTADRWALEVYRTLMGTLRSIAIVLFVLFLVSLIAYMVLRNQEREAAQQPRRAGLSPTAA